MWYKLSAQIGDQWIVEENNPVSEGDLQPKSLEPYQNYPNPFNPSTTIQYEVSAAAKVELNVDDLLGKEVSELVDTRQPAGSYQVIFNRSKLSSGVYVYQLVVADKAVLSKK